MLSGHEARVSEAGQTGRRDEFGVPAQSMKALSSIGGPDVYRLRYSTGPEGVAQPSDKLGRHGRPSDSALPGTHSNIRGHHRGT